MQTRDQAFLGTEPVGRLLMRLAIPTVIAQLVNMLYNIVDRIYIGHIAGIGSLALTGVGVCMPRHGRKAAGRQLLAANRDFADADGGAAAVRPRISAGLRRERKHD